MKAIHHTCAKCGVSFTGPARRKYCSRNCARADRGPAWNRGMSGGKGKPRTRVEKICEGCGVRFEAFAYHAATRRFCNMACYHRDRWGGVRSQGAICANCGSGFTFTECDPRIYCSHPCYVASGAGTKAGPDSPRWKGGTSRHYRRGQDWKRVSASIRERDQQACKDCGKLASDLTGARKLMDVHHIIPWCVEPSNDPANLVSLCRSCHHRNEPSPEAVARLKADPTHRRAFLAEAQSRWGIG